MKKTISKVKKTVKTEMFKTKNRAKNLKETITYRKNKGTRGMVSTDQK